MRSIIPFVLLIGLVYIMVMMTSKLQVDSDVSVDVW